jgi:catechol 2,3-dioxygenase-like lactoylglutathione lyase family enzyme
MIELGSVNLAVKDMLASERFYVDVLGLEVDEERSNRPSFLLLRAANYMLILQDGTDSPESTVPSGNIEIAFQVDDLKAVQASLGAEAVIQQMGWGTAIEIKDPNGVRLNLYQAGSVNTR